MTASDMTSSSGESSISYVAVHEYRYQMMQERMRADESRRTAQRRATGRQASGDGEGALVPSRQRRGAERASQEALQVG